MEMVWLGKKYGIAKPDELRHTTAKDAFVWALKLFMSCFDIPESLPVQHGTPLELQVRRNKANCVKGLLEFLQPLHRYLAHRERDLSAQLDSFVLSKMQW